MQITVVIVVAGQQQQSGQESKGFWGDEHVVIFVDCGNRGILYMVDWTQSNWRTYTIFMQHLGRNLPYILLTKIVRLNSSKKTSQIIYGISTVSAGAGCCAFIIWYDSVWLTFCATHDNSMAVGRRVLLCGCLLFVVFRRFAFGGKI